MTGRRLGNYDIQDKLGEGGMGEVWRARDARLNRSVAIKILPADVAGDPSRRQRFEQEARALGALNHPNIVAVYDVGQSEGQAYIVSELVEGESLRKVIERGAVPVRKIIEIATQTAEGIAAAHALGIIHRDLKPENVMVTRDGRAKVLDFGLAKQQAPKGGDETATIAMSQPGMILGTVGYMSPEQVRGEAVDARSDIFSFGCVLYELATGSRAFQGKSAADVMSAILREEPKEVTAFNAALPAAIDSIVRRCLEKDPARRFQSAADLAFALRSVSNFSSTQSAAASPARPSRKWIVPAVCALGAAATVRCRLLRARPHVQIRAAGISPPHFSGRPDHLRALQSGRPERGLCGGVGGWTRTPVLRHPGQPRSSRSWCAAQHQAARRFLQGRPGAAHWSFQSGWLRHAVAQFAGRRAVARPPRERPLRRLVARRFGDGDHASRQRQHPHRISGRQGAVWKGSGSTRSFAFHRMARASLTPLTTTGLRFASIRYPATAACIRSQLYPARLSDRLHVPLTWTRDGREIWFRSYDESTSNTIRAADMSGKTRVVARFPSRTSLYDIAADGRLLLSADSGRVGIRAMAPGENPERDLSCLESSMLRDLTPDGRIILVNIVGESGGPKGSIYWRLTDGSPMVRLGDGFSFGISPDGKWVTGYSSRDTARRMFVLMPTGPGDEIPVRIPPSNRRAAWSSASCRERVTIS